MSSSDFGFSVEEVIRMCEMESYADAIVGNIGEGLNVEQRKVSVIAYFCDRVLTYLFSG